VILVTYPNIVDSKDQTLLPYQIGNDIKRIKDIGIDHVLFVFNFLPIGRDVDSMIEKTKLLSKLVR
jgi:hypothetical protein